MQASTFADRSVPAPGRRRRGAPDPLLPIRMTWYSLSLLIALLAPSAAFHTRLARSEPVADATLAASPSELRLWFEGGVEAAFTEVALHAASGARLALGAPTAGGEEGLIRVPVPLALPPDTYTVRWQTVGGDGHRIAGEFRFSVAGAAGGSPPPTAASTGVDSSAWGAGTAGRTVVGPRVIDADDPAAMPTAAVATPSAIARIGRWAELAALVIALGGVAMLLLVLRTARGSPAHERFVASATRRVRTIAIAAAAAFVLLTVWRLALESDSLHRGAGMTVAALGRTLGTAWARAWSIGALAMVVLAAALLRRREADASGALHRPARGNDLVLGIAALVAAVGPALTGHAGNAAAALPFAVLTDWLHVIGAAAWIGGVALLAMAGAPAALVQPEGDRAPSLAWLVSAFHALAVPAIVLVGASGIVSAWLRVGSWDALTHTNYGNLLLFKVYVVAFAALMGAYHWYRVHPRLVAAAAREREARTMSWTLYLELVAGLVVLALTAALVTIAPPR